MSTLYRGGRVHAAGAPTALVVDGDVVSWLGAAADAPVTDELVELDDGWLAPAFVDAHVHATSYGLALTGLDLTGVPSLALALDRLERHCRAAHGAPVLGTGWDETRWPEGRPPTGAELDRASYGSVVYLARTDVHGAVVSSALLAAAPQARGLPGFGADGFVTLEAHHACRRAANAAVTDGQRRAAQRATLRRAAALGVGCVHEMAGPDISSERDLAALLELATTEPGPEVIGYWADLEDVETPARHGLRGGAGDLFVDGTIGSHTAALTAPYADSAESGTLRYDASDVTRHVTACVRAGSQPGFHVIGDAAIDAVLDGLERAAATVGLDALRAAQPRLEHVEMAGPSAVARLAALGGIASVQPAFDALWGGPDGMYAQRLGVGRALPMNPFAAFAAAGVPLALGSDAPVTPIDPWGGVRGAVRHRTAGAGLSPAAAFNAATRGGWAAARVDGGRLRPGAPATFAVWDTTSLQAALDATPTCRRTVVRGRVRYDVELEKEQP